MVDKEYWEAINRLKEKVKERDMDNCMGLIYVPLEKNIKVPVNNGEGSIMLDRIEYNRLINEISCKILKGELEGTIVTLGNVIRYKLEINI